MNYSDLVTLQGEYTYSANVEFDIRNDSKLHRFIPNKTTISLFRDYFCDIASDNPYQHARMLYGSYGTGKSHFLTVLSILLSKRFNDGVAYRTFIHRIKAYDDRLANDIDSFEKDKNKKPFLIVPITFDFPNFDRCIYFSLQSALRSVNKEITFKTFYDQAIRIIDNWEGANESNSLLKTLCRKYKTNLSKLKDGLASLDKKSENIFRNIFKEITYGVDFVYEVASISDAIKQANDAISDSYSGIVFIFDEFGRYLEDNIKSIKVKSVQDLAECCDHSDGNNHIILVSHREISLYTREYGKTIVNEWKKVEGRYAATSINSKSDQCLSLVKDIIVKKDDEWEGFKEKHNSKLKKLFSDAADFKGFLIDADEGIEFFEGGFPIHPVALYALDKLSKKIAQNERTFFTFLASKEKNSLYDFLINTDVTEFHFVGLDRIFDYFEQNIKSNQTSENYDIYKHYQVSLSKNISHDNCVIDEQVLKAIALIGIVNDEVALTANLNLLTSTLDYSDDEIKNSIDSLVSKKILKYSGNYDRYEFYDASIFDIDKLIENNIDNISDNSISNTLNAEFVNFMLYPHMYNFSYKINRMFIPIFLRLSDFNKKTLSKYLSKYYDGALIMLLCSKDESDAIDYNNIINTPRSIVFANLDGDDLIYAVKRYLAICYLESVSSQYTEKDPSFAQELEYCKSEQIEIIKKLIDEWKNMKISSYQVVNNKKEELNLSSFADLSKQASEIMYSSYSSTMIVNNELINKNTISRTMNIAQKKAVESIINGGITTENYGLTYLSPEYLIVRSIIGKNGIIRDLNLNGEINTLENGQASSYSVKTTFEKFIDQAKSSPVCFNDLYDTWKRPPIGLRDGIMPVLIAALFNSYRSEVVILSHGIEKAYSFETITSMIERPNDYEFGIVSLTNEQRDFISKLESRFKDYIEKTLYAKNKMEAIYDAMFTHYKMASKFARTTEKYVSDKTKAYRRMMVKSYSNYSLFVLHKLKKFGGDYLTSYALIKQSCDELDVSLQKMQKEVIERIFDVLSLDRTLNLKNALYQKYKSEWEEKRNKSFDYYTNSFLEFCSKSNEYEDDNGLLNTLSRIITGFETNYWNDDNKDEFVERIEEVNSKLSAYISSNDINAKETKITIQTASATPKTMIFDNSELSQLSQTLKNKINTDMNNFGMAVTYEEKIQILLSLLEELMEGK